MEIVKAFVNRQIDTLNQFYDKMKKLRSFGGLFRLPNCYGMLHGLGVLLARQLFINNFLALFPNLNIDIFNNITLLLFFLVILGGRMMSCLQRDTEKFSLDTRTGGISIFGDYIGGLIASCLIASYYRLNTVMFVESIMLTSSFQPIFGRLGNWINGELDGKYSKILRRNHPQQFYQLVLEGIVMSWILWSMIDKIGDGTIWLTMPLIYALIRIVCESFKQTDEGMPKWYYKTLYKYLIWARFQSLCLPVIFWSIYFIVK